MLLSFRRKWVKQYSNAAARRKCCRPGVELLEDRRLPSMFLVTNTLDAGAGSLRQAILDANANPGPDLIDFNIPGAGVQTIAVGDTTFLPLPIITDPVAIDGYSQPGASVNTLSVGDNAVVLIQLDGSNLGPGFNALHITAGNSTVRGLMIDNFARTAGPAFAGGNAILLDTNGGNVVEGSILGTHGSGPPGTFGSSNGNSDVAVAADSPFNVIGGTTPDTRNVLSGAGQGALIASSGNLFQGNYVGTDATGTSAVPNLDGLVESGTGDTIGGTTTGAQNVFSGNNRSGVAMGFAVNDVVEGNLIGINAQGTATLTNGSFGILAAAGSGDTIGGTAAGAGNVIGGVSGLGIEIDDSGAPSGTNSFLIQGNFFGTDRTGTPNFGNAIGILIEGNAVTQGVANNTVSGNVIDNEFLVGVEIFGVAAKDNVVEGNLIDTDPTGTPPSPTGTGVEIAGGAFDNTVGGTTAAARNVISGNTVGVLITGSGTTGNVVDGNYVGTDATGTHSVANGTGVEIAGGASDNTVGGTTAVARNVISGNSVEGLSIADSATTGNLVEGNYVGTDASGSVPVANFDGIALSGTGNTIGGAAAGAGNVISGNVRIGVAMGFAFNDVVEGNLIGVNAQGTGRLTNGSFGILAAECSGDTIGGTTAGAGNVIGGLSGDGIEIDDSGAPDGTNANVVEGNFLGTDPTGQFNFGNAIGILLEGNAVSQGVANNTIGGTAAGAGNVIANESLVGVEIFGIAAHNNVVEGNRIGTNPAGSMSLGNGVGVEVAGGAHNNVIGGPATGPVPAGAANVIDFNKGAGVVVGSSIKDTATVGNTIRGNSIYKNGGLGIDLGNDGVTPNHLHNPSPGPNNLQNFPVLSFAISLPNGHTLVIGRLHSAPNTTFTLDFYASATADPSGHGEGQRYLGSGVVIIPASGVVKTDARGNVFFVVDLSAATTRRQVISATATDPGGDTSEFSAV
ncbi:MAG TPA: hypothetical protein VGY66_24720, partial [Gemmataceae bacterium]|nr:hypothetical protein [Gemmataceae bacterium]